MKFSPLVFTYNFAVHSDSARSILKSLLYQSVRDFFAKTFTQRARRK